MSRRVTAAGVVVAAIVGAWSFLFYGAGRTMTEAVGVSPRGTFGGLFICAVFTVPPVVGMWIGARLLVRDGLSDAIVAAIVAGVMAGCAASEAAILADESRFAAEVAADPSRDRSRARAWPNRDAGLVYVTGLGIRATD